MARHPQAREVAELKGATRVHPERYRKQPPAVDMPLGNAPDHLDRAGEKQWTAKEVWFELSSYAPRVVLTGADRITVEIASNLLVEYRTAPSEFRAGKYVHLIGCLARLGMTPADRQKLGVEKPSQESNPFDSF
jgi:hypothetical protein